MATFESYGAVGDGVTDDRDAIYNALNSGNAIRTTKGKEYYIGSNVIVAGKNIDVSGGGFFKFSNTAYMELKGTVGAATTLGANANVDDTEFTLVSSAGFNIGDIISVTTSEDFSWGYQVTEHYRKGE